MHGAFPRKSYLCVEPMDGGRSRWHRLKGWTLGGGTFPLGDGTALLAGQVMSGGMRSAQDKPRAQALLRVRLGDGSVVQDLTAVAPGRVLDAGRPAWSDKPLALLQAADGLRVSPVEDGSSFGKAPAVLPGRMGAAAFASDEPLVAATSYDQQGGKLSFIGVGGALDAGGKTLRLRSPGLVTPLGGGRWAVTLVDEEDRDVLTALDERTGAAKVLATADGPFETVAAGPRWLYAVALDPHGHFDPRRKWLHPREIRRLDLTGHEPEWRAPWTQRQGRLLSVDEGSGRLWFAVTDRDAAAVWSLPLDPAKLEAAVPDIDGRGAFARLAALGVFWLVSLALGAAISMAAWFFIWRGPGGGPGGGRR